MLQRAYKTELDPTAAQRKMLASHVAGARLAHNWVLEQWRTFDACRAIAMSARWLSGNNSTRAGEFACWLGFALAALHFGEPIEVRTPSTERPQMRKRYKAVPGVQIPDYRSSSIDWNSMLVHVRAEQPERFGWLSDLSSFAIREAALDVSDGWKHFFDHLKAKRYDRAGPPRFRNRSHASYHADQPDPIRVTDKAVKIPGVGWVRLKERGYLPATAENSHQFTYGGKAIGLGISEVDGRWYVALRCSVPSPVAQQRGPGRALRDRPTPRVKGRRVGVENGVRVLAVAYDGDSGGTISEGGLRDDRRIQKLTMLRKRWERRMARRMRMGSNGKPLRASEQSSGWHEAAKRVGHYYARIVQLRDDRVGKIVRKIVDSGAETILLREPHTAKLLSRKTAPDAQVRNRLAPHVHGARMGDIRERLEYKQKWAGGQVILVDKFEPVTKRCSECGAVRESSPAYPNFRCANCGHTEDRDDANAPKNLYNYSGSSSPGAADPRSAGSNSPQGDNGQEKRSARPGAQDPGTAGSQGGEISALGSGNRPCAGAPCSARPRDPFHDLSFERSGATRSGSPQFRGDTAIDQPTRSSLSQNGLQASELSTHAADGSKGEP